MLQGHDPETARDGNTRPFHPYDSLQSPEVLKSWADGNRKHRSDLVKDTKAFGEHHNLWSLGHADFIHSASLVRKEVKALAHQIADVLRCDGAIEFGATPRKAYRDVRDLHGQHTLVMESIDQDA